METIQKIAKAVRDYGSRFGYAANVVYLGRREYKDLQEYARQNAVYAAWDKAPVQFNGLLVFPVDLESHVAVHFDRNFDF